MMVLQAALWRMCDGEEPFCDGDVICWLYSLQWSVFAIRSDDKCLKETDILI